ncbi:DUF2399 domain-containing protein [Phytohabitans houttuyneae]|uniref:Uncharacterized protein n=1 Tax=Phytohabitans houttuyneae TaxID=1076126 RepID=A0A6V8KBN3_9ACTN|nr:hypothetical protein Phou_033070 [Phytohabitans houttuyneae]
MRSVAPAARPWRYDTATYASYLGLTGVADADGEQGQFRQLRQLYAQHQIPLHEETLLDQLISDLAKSGSVTPLFRHSCHGVRSAVVVEDPGELKLA